MPTNQLTHPIKMAANELIRQRKISKYFEIDEHFEQAPGWFSDIINDRKKIESRLTDIVGFIRLKDEEVALEMVSKIVGWKLTTWDLALEDFHEKIIKISGMDDEQYKKTYLSEIIEDLKRLSKEDLKKLHKIVKVMFSEKLEADNKGT